MEWNNNSMNNTEYQTQQAPDSRPINYNQERARHFVKYHGKKTVLAAVILIAADGIFVIEIHLRLASRKGGEARIRISIRRREGFKKLVVIQKLGVIRHREEIEKFLLLHLGKNLVWRCKSVRIGGMRVRVTNEDLPFSVGIGALCLAHGDLADRFLRARLRNQPRFACGG